MAARVIVLTFVAALFLLGIVRGDNVTNSPAFKTLQDALVFIDTTLDKEDWNGLSKALYPPFQENDPNRNYWQQLKDERGKLRLAAIFANRSFPATDESFEIGASNDARAQFAGWSRIKFVKVQDGWHLSAVYGIR